MEGNLYSAFAAAFAPKEQGGFFIGTVTSAEPLQVDVGGISVSGGSLWVNAALIQRDYDGEIFLPSHPDGAFSEPHGAFTLKELPLAAGDRVVLLTEDDQVFYLVCKVVSG